MQSKTKIALGFILFLFGLILAQAVAIAIFWPDMEANLFDQSLAFEDSLRTLRCPVLLSRAETADISARFTNSTDRQTSFFVRTHISEGNISAMREFQELVELEAGETVVKRWDVSPSDAAFGSLVMARVATLRRPGLAPRDAACGILVLPFSGISGQLVLAAAILISLGSMAGGGVVWLQEKRPLRRHDRSQAIAMGMLASLITFDLVISLLSYWTLGLIILILTFLLMGALLDRFVPH